MGCVMVGGGRQIKSKIEQKYEENCFQKDCIAGANTAAGTYLPTHVRACVEEQAA